MSPEQRLERRDEIWEALFSRKETSDLIRVHRAYGSGTRADKRLRARLRDSNRGPRAGAMEPAHSTHARDVFAELCWGAMLELNNMHTRVDADTDVLQVEKAGSVSVSCAWEVKRPRTTASVAGAVLKGLSQIADACEGRINRGYPPADFGCVIVVLDRVLMPTAPFLIGSSRDEARIRLGEAIDAVIEELRPTLPPPTQYSATVGFWWRPLASIDGVATECHQRRLCWLRARDRDDWRDQYLAAWFDRADAR